MKIIRTLLKNLTILHSQIKIKKVHLSYENNERESHSIDP